MDFVFFVKQLLFQLLLQLIFQKKNINSEEITIEDFTKNINNWKFSYVQKNQIYQTSSFNLFNTNFIIRTKEWDIQLTKPFKTIQLLSQKSLQKHKQILQIYPYWPCTSWHKTSYQRRPKYLHLILQKKKQKNYK